MWQQLHPELDQLRQILGSLLWALTVGRTETAGPNNSKEVVCMLFFFSLFVQTSASLVILLALARGSREP